MAFVLDASITTTWAFDDESDAVADAAWSLMTVETAIVPSLWWYEARNALLVGERRRRLTASQTAYALDQLADLPIAMEADLDEDAVFHFARTHKLTFYDAAYLALAAERHLPLATLDGALVVGARAEDVPLIGRS